MIRFQRHFRFSVMLVLLVMGKGFSQNKLAYTSVKHTFLNSGDTTSLYVRPGTPANDGCGYRINKALFNAYLNMGSTYKFGTSTFSSSVTLKIDAYNSYSGTGSLVDSYTIQLQNDQDAPEKLFSRDFTAQHASINRFVISVTGYTAPVGTNFTDSIQVALYFTEEFGIDVSNATTTQLTPVLGNPATFSWQPDCKNIPNYQFQLLRLYNTTSADNYDQDTSKTKAPIDWSKALTIETQSPDTFLILPIVEGSGHYVWRVRAIGTDYPGGIADSRNWGKWSNALYPDGTVIDLVNTLTNSYTFYYAQFDAGKNWIYSRTFSEGDFENSKVRMDEQMKYANGLGMVRQAQSFSPADGTVLVSQTYYDWSGRAALATLPAPTTQTKLGYYSAFAKYNTSLYGAALFDSDTTYTDPKPFTSGPLVTYYSDANPDSTVASAEGYPYSRTLFDGDGIGRVREQSGPGNTHRIKPSGMRTTRTYYGSVSNTELIRVFGDEAPADSSVHKTLNIDANNTASIAYIDKQGHTIATCLSIGSDNTTLDTLVSQAGARFTVSDTLKKTTPYGTYGISSTKQLVLATTTSVQFEYNIDPKEIRHLCTDVCNSCDYTVDILIKGEASTEKISKLLPAQDCGVSHKWGDTTFTRTLNPGTYTIEKRVYANNYKPGTGSATSSPVRYPDIQTDTIRERLQKDADTRLATVYSYLNTSNMTGLYTYLGKNMNVPNPDSTYAGQSVRFEIGCTDSISIPIDICNADACAGNHPDFEKYFEQRWKDSTGYVGVDGSGYLNYLHTAPYLFKRGQFNYMIYQMLTDNVLGTYSCSQLWDCWKRVTETYFKLKGLSDTTDYNFDLLNEFLTCTGRKYIGYSSTDTSQYIGKAYKYFYYDGNNADCNTLVGSTTGWTQDTLYGLPQNKKWEKYYSCIKNYNSDIIPPGTDATTATASSIAACNAMCELRYQSFVTAVTNSYHNDSVYVEGDKYKLKSDNTWGWNTMGFSTDTIPSAFSNYIPRSKIECAARSLVENCKSNYCVLTTFKTGSHIDSIGTVAQQLAMQKAMTWGFETKMSKGLSCDAGWDNVRPVVSSDTAFLKLWEKHYGSAGENKLWDVVKDESGIGGYLLVGTTDSIQSNDITQVKKGRRDYWIIKINQQGDKIWDRRIGGSLDDSLTTVTQTRDGGYLLGGFSNSGISGDKSQAAVSGTYDFWVVKISPLGSILWDKTYGTDDDDLLKSVYETSDGYYLLCGSSNYMKLSANGKKIWGKELLARNKSWQSEVIRETMDGNYVLGITTVDLPDVSGMPTVYNYELVKTDTAGNILHSGSITGDNSGTLYQNYLMAMEPIKTPADSGFIMAGLSNAPAGTSPPYTKAAGRFNTDGSYDLWVVKFDKNFNRVWDSIYGGTGIEGPVDNKYVDIKEIPGNKGFLIAVGSKSPMNTGNKKDTLYNNTYDYWLTAIEGDGRKKWDRSFGGNNDDNLTALDRDDMGNILLAGYSYSANTGNKTTANYDGTLNTADYWIIKGREVCEHDTVCFRWIKPITNVADSNKMVMNIISCDSAASLRVRNSIQAQVEQFIDKEVAAYRANYLKTCASPDSIKDQLVLTYDLGLHHFTLYYYDRAGNLVRTVPPKGVDYSSTTRSMHPNHTYVTSYKYNSLKQLIQQETPDGGITLFWYDNKGRLRFSQNANQKAKNKYSYTKYDDLSRIIEVGQSNQDIAGSAFLGNIDTAAYPVSGNEERTYTVYTTPGSNGYYIGNVFQRYLQNRVSYTYTDDKAYTYYSYDPHGNVEWLVQEIPELGRNYIRYEYDLISNKVLAAHYNEGRIDETHHRYIYDVNQRLVKAFTSWGKGELSAARVLKYSSGGGLIASALSNGWDRDAKYIYYKHGPLKRIEIGEDNVQGVDYVYTINGWIKAINYPTLQAFKDPGKDNNTTFAIDLFGMSLGYHANDFNRTGSVYSPATGSLVSSQSGVTDLYNGNISSWTLKTGAGQMGFIYRYDQLNRLKTEDYRSYSTSWSNPADTYDNTYTYDANGNISTLNRAGDGVAMDQLTYNYVTGTNKLLQVMDAIAPAATNDVDDQPANNYAYDEIGNLVKDSAESIRTISWNVYGKIKSIRKANNDSLLFLYDASGNRVVKVDKPVSAANTKVTYYVRDAGGNLLSTYIRTMSGSDYVYRQDESYIYGSSRLGVQRPLNRVVKTTDTTGHFLTCTSCITSVWTYDLSHFNGYYTRNINQKAYELSDHLGNVRVAFSDQKLSTGAAQEWSYANYYAFGMEMPGKNYNANSYRYGFNGQEKDDEISGAGNSYTAEFWQYDPRLGRRWNIDPVVKPWMSSYHAFSNRPITNIDPNGDNDGDYYSKDGKHLGSDGLDDNKVYTADDVTKDNKGIVTSAVNAQDLGIKHTEFATSSNVVKHESSGNKEESLWIAHAANNAKDDDRIDWKRKNTTLNEQLTDPNYSTTPAEARTALSVTDNSQSAMNARAAVISVHSGAADPTEGAVLWDGTDFLTKGNKHNKFKEYSNVTIDADHLGNFILANRKGKIDVKTFIKPYVLNRQFSVAGKGKYNSLESTGTAGKSIFWKLGPK